MLRLAVHHEKSVRRFSLPRAEAVLGSAEDCDLHAPYPGISRRHARLRPLDGGLLVTDLGSKNGLVRDGAPVAEVLLRPSESVRLGRALLALEEVDSSDAAVALALPGTRPARRRKSSDTGSLTELPGDGSPAAALAAVRAVERAGGIDPARPDEARRILELGRAALEAAAIWIWTGGADAPPVLALAGQLPDETELAELARRAAASTTPVAVPVAAGAALVSPSSPGHPSLAARLQGPSERVPEWKLDLFDYLAAKVKRAPKRTPPPPAAPELGSDAQPLRFPDEFVRGESVPMEKLLANLVTAAKSRLDVLLLGETGTGKELVAHAIHESGPTAKGPFLAINCAAIPAELLEAQLFGVEARVATGVDPRPGLFLKANGGSLFLDEVGDLPEPLQAKLLRALQEREILPLGATSPKKIDVRVISASNKDLGALVREGRYRADLYYRLRGLQFHMPPLRERKEDLPHLVLAFAQRAAREYDKTLTGVSRRALSILAAYDWPGNVRELKNEVERAVLLCPDGGALESEHFGPVAWVVENPRLPRLSRPGDRSSASEGFASLHGSTQDTDDSEPEPSERLQDQIERLERRLLLETLRAVRGNRSEAARRLGITRNGLALKVKRLGLAP